MNVDVPVQITVDSTELVTQPIATECPQCFAIIRRQCLAEHQQVMHEPAT